MLTPLTISVLIIILVVLVFVFSCGSSSSRTSNIMPGGAKKQYATTPLLTGAETKADGPYASVENFCGTAFSCGLPSIM